MHFIVLVTVRILGRRLDSQIRRAGLFNIARSTRVFHLHKVSVLKRDVPCSFP